MIIRQVESSKLQSLTKFSRLCIYWCYLNSDGKDCPDLNIKCDEIGFGEGIGLDKICEWSFYWLFFMVFKSFSKFLFCFWYFKIYI